MIPELFLARRYLFRGKSRHISFIGIVSCMGIALGIATLIVVISVMNGFDRDLVERFTRVKPHLIIESLDPEYLNIIKEKIKTWEEVSGASVFIQTQVFAKFDKLIVPLVVKGIDFTDKQERKQFYQYVEDVSGNEGFFVGEGLKNRFFISDEIEFYPLVKKFKAQNDKVRGVFKLGLFDIDNNYLITDLEKAKSLSPNYLIFLGVRLDDPFTANEVKKKILCKYNQGVFVTTWVESDKVLFSALKLEKLTMFIILSLIVLVASFNIFATVTVSVVEKTKDIGILKSLGFSSSRILAIFSSQGLILGFIGTFWGALLGCGLCIGVEKYQFIKLPVEIYYIEYLPMAIDYGDISLIIGVGMFLSYVFSLIPAIRASNLSPSKALRYE